MIYRKVYETTAEMSAWYGQKYTEMGGTWMESPECLNERLDEMGVPKVLSNANFFLDVGCGGGHMIAESVQRCPSIGLDMSLVALEYARKLLPRHESLFIQGSIEATGWNDGTFNFIYSGGSLEHVIDLNAALKEIHRLLRADGVWYFLLPTLGWTYEDQPNERCATAEEWIELFSHYGLKSTWHKLIGDSLVSIKGVKI